jgi:Na+-transporting NADH:ubiquinone oxidoreductase subunit B
MLAILFANIFAPLIDYFVTQANIRRRQRRLRVAAETAGQSPAAESAAAAE